MGLGGYPGHTRNGWLDHLWRDNGTPLDLWKVETSRHMWTLGSDATVLGDYALTMTTTESYFQGGIMCNSYIADSCTCKCANNVIIAVGKKSNPSILTRIRTQSFQT